MKLSPSSYFVPLMYKYSLLFKHAQPIFFLNVTYHVSQTTHNTEDYILRQIKSLFLLVLVSHPAGLFITLHTKSATICVHNFAVWIRLITQGVVDCLSVQRSLVANPCDDGSNKHTSGTRFSANSQCYISQTAN